MERNDAVKLLKAYKSWWDDKPCDELNEIDKEFLDSYFNNCLEAKPKALHSMKCDENEFYCENGGWGGCLTQCGTCYEEEHEL